MYWLEVSVPTDEAGSGAVAEAIRPFAYNDGVVLEQLGDLSSPAPDLLETAVTVKIYLPAAEDTPERRRDIEASLERLAPTFVVPPPTFRKLEEQDWANAWKAHYHPFRIGKRLWIQPSWIAVDDVAAGEIQADDVVLTLDPGMAFGTGLHPTTQLCLQVLEARVQPGQRLLDVGTGSGILAIAAAKLGAQPIVAIDNDPLAVETAVANAQLNQVADVIAAQTGTLDALSPRAWDLVVVNILAPVIINLLTQDNLMAFVAEEGVLILSGIVTEQAGAVETAVVQAGGQPIETRQMGDWVCLVVQHAAST